MTTLKERSKSEATANPVFLFQEARWIHTGIPYSMDGEYAHDGEGVCLGKLENRVWEPYPDSDYLTDEELSLMETEDGVPCAIKTWNTVCVFLTREGAEKHGEELKYRYPSGYRVFAVQAMGLLPKTIEAAESLELMP